MSLDRQRRIRLGLGLGALTLLLLAAGLAAGGEGWSIADLMRTLNSPDAALIVGQIRAPRTLARGSPVRFSGLRVRRRKGSFATR